GARHWLPHKDVRRRDARRLTSFAGPPDAERGAAEATREVGPDLAAASVRERVVENLRRRCLDRLWLRGLAHYVTFLRAFSARFASASRKAISSSIRSRLPAYLWASSRDSPGRMQRGGYRRSRRSIRSTVKGGSWVSDMGEAPAP